jgi:molybdopterin biosynthesis enzyme
VTLNENGFTVIPTFKRASSVRAFSTVNGLIVIPADSSYLRTGDKVRVQIIAEPESDS